MDFQARRTSGFGGVGVDAPGMTPIDPEDLDMAQFMMESQQAQDPNLLHTSPPLDIMSNPQFANFSFSYQNVSEQAVEAEHDPYNVSLQDQPPEHRQSISSLPSASQPNYGNVAADAQARNTSVSDGSEDGSPTSNRNPGAIQGSYGDEFGLNNAAPGDGSDLGARSKEEKNDRTPAWSELKTKAGKERKRLPLACIACRRKKIRCSGEKPACKHCLRSRIPCVYKVTTRKAAPRTDYMAMLDKRLKRMEERIIKIVPKQEQESAIPVVRAAVKPGIPGSTPIRNPTSKKRGAEEAFGSDLENWAKPSPASNMDSGSKPVSLVAQETQESELLTEGADKLPSKEIQEHLAEVFFENVYGQTYHLLHKPSFMRKLKLVHSQIHTRSC
jgi:hypothetical protein